MAVKQQRRRGRPPATRGEGEDTRGLLLEAAAKLIAERGYRGTSVNEVIARAGLSKGTFYWHFRSKHELLVAVLDERFDRPVRELAELLKTASAQEDMAPEASRRFLELVGRRRETVVLEHEYRSLAVRDARLRARYRRRQNALRDVLAAGLEARAKQLGAPPFSTPSRDVATAYLALGSGLAVERLIDPAAVRDDLLGETVALVYQGLVARATGASRSHSAGAAAGSAPGASSGRVPARSG